MRNDLAKKLLAATLELNPADIERYCKTFDDLAELKFDSYQQYTPSNRFAENFSLWITQFQTIDERKIALDFVLKKLIFISPSEMLHLINSVYPDLIEPILIKQALTIQKEHPQIKLDICQQIIQKQSLYIALSDGARIDSFRRSSKPISHEQVLISYDVPEDKFDEVKRKIHDSANSFYDTLSIPKDVKDELNPDMIYNIFLIDDFSGSGVSYLRLKEGDWNGKISKAVNILYKSGILKETDNNSNPQINLILYLITEQAREALKTNIEMFTRTKSGLVINVAQMQVVHCAELTNDELKLFEKYYSDKMREEIETTHFKLGKHDRPYLGFDECGLSLVIYHNTPNNTLPILWAGEKPLFKRVTRHRDEV